MDQFPPSSGQPGDGQPNPFGNIPLFGDLAKMMQQQGSLDWNAAQQFALSVLADPSAAPDNRQLMNNVDPLDRIKLEEYGKIAEMFVTATTGFPVAPNGQSIAVNALTPVQWVTETLARWKPIVEKLGAALRQSSSTGSGASSSVVDPSSDFGSDVEAGFASMLNGILGMVAPTMLGMSTGSMAGHQAKRAFSLYELPVPASELRIGVVPATIDAFANEWSIDVDSLRLWVVLHDMTYQTLMNIPHVYARLNKLIHDHASGFRSNPNGLMDRLDGMEMDSANPLDGLQKLLSDPELLIGATGSPEQAIVAPQLDATVAVLVGYVDWVLDEAGPRLIGAYQMTSEALRRRRVESTQADRLTERLLGVNLTRAQVSRGQAFIAGIIERSGAEALSRIFEREEDFPTPNDVEAPGLWLARIGLD